MTSLTVRRDDRRRRVMALGYRGSLQIVDEIASDDRRAELLASYLLVTRSPS